MTLLKWIEGQLVKSEASADEAILELPNDHDVCADFPDLTNVGVVVLNFPVLRDGRAFTQARLIRESGFEGDIRATGALFLDQIGMALRCGFSSFLLENDLDADAAVESAARFAVYYQRAASGAPAWERRV